VSLCWKAEKSIFESSTHIGFSVKHGFRFLKLLAHRVFPSFRRRPESTPFRPVNAGLDTGFRRGDERFTQIHGRLSAALLRITESLLQL
jgi:hypothetical protein